MSDIIRIKPLQFVHVLDLNSNITRVVLGPNAFVLQSHERRVAGPLPYIVVSLGHYARVQDPCSKYVEGEPIVLSLGRFDVRFHGEPFFLYPGESLPDAPNFGDRDLSFKPALKPLPVIKANHGLLLEARLDFQDGKEERKAGDRWQVTGPCTYLPRPEVDVLRNIIPHVIHDNQALKLRARQATVDCNGRKRVTGEEWLVDTVGAYLPAAFEEIVEEVHAITLTAERAIYLQATCTVEVMGKERKAGEQWLLTDEQCDSFLPPIGVEILKSPVDRTVLGKSKYCVVLDPVDKSGKPQMGKKEVRIGVQSFFLHPGERLEKGIQPAYILGDNEAVALQAEEEFTDHTSSKKGVRRAPGEKWMVYGPIDFIPNIHMKVIDRRTAIAMSKNEGVYVRDQQSGIVRAVMGPVSYMLTEHETLWEKILPAQVEELLKKGGGAGNADIRKIAYFEQSIDPAILKGRDKTRVVTYRCPNNTACQIYNHLKKTARVCFGPDFIILDPHEDFNVLSLSAGKPKEPHQLKSLALMLGPDFITDIIVVETSDHARLQIKLAFNNHFDYDASKPEEAAILFSVPDFIGYACNQVGSKIRQKVAQISFDQFHKESARIIQSAVMGRQKKLKFESNNLVISNIDIQSIEPVDLKMRDSLMKSVQMAIEIATNSIEAAASHEAARTEQIAKGELERMRLTNQQAAERERAKLCEIQAICAAVESTGQAVAEAKAHAEKSKIEAQSEIEAVTLRAEAVGIEFSAQQESQRMLRSAELAYQKKQNNTEVGKLRSLNEIEISKFARMVNTLGRQTIQDIACSGPASQAKLLGGLGLDSVLITDGNSPINLFRTAEGLIQP